MASHFLFNDFALHTASRTLLWRDAAVAIEPKVFDVLAYLVEHRERAVGRDELIAAVWGRVDVADATLQQAISRLRRALRETPDSTYVRTVPRHGYQWVAATRRAAPPPDATALVPMATDNAPDAAPPAAAPVSAPRRLHPALLVFAVVAGIALLVAAMLLATGRPGSSDTAALPGGRDDAAPAATARACQREASAEDCLRTLSALLAHDSLPLRERAALLLERAEQSLRIAALEAAADDLDAVDGLPDLPPEAAARSLFLRHRMALAAGRPDDAMAFGQRALALYRSQPPSDAYAELLLSLGTVSGRRGELERAQSWLDAALSVYDASGNDEGAARVLSTRAYTLSQQGRLADSLAAARQAQSRAAAAQVSSDVRREALSALAWSSIQNGRLGEAREAVHAALNLPAAAVNAQQTVSLHALLGFIDAAGGRFREALAAWDGALALAPESSASPASAGLRLAMVYAALQIGDRPRAQQQFAQLQQMAGQTPSLQTTALHAHALIAMADRDDEQAARLFAEVWKGARQSGSLNQQMLADYADVLLRRRELDTLESLLGEPSLPAQEGYLYQLVQARYLASRGRHADARAAFDRARALAGERYSHWLDVTRQEVMAHDGSR